MAPPAAGVSLAPAGGRSFFPVLPRRPAPLQRPQLLQRGKGVASGSSVAAPPLRRWRVVAGGVYRWSSPAAGSPMDSHDESEKEMSPSGLDAAKAANLQDTKVRKLPAWQGARRAGQGTCGRAQVAGGAGSAWRPRAAPTSSLTAALLFPAAGGGLHAGVHDGPGVLHGKCR